MLNKEEFKDVFDIHYDAIRSYVFYRCGDMEMASDVTQDVFMRVWEKRNVLNVNYLKPLLYKMASDVYISYYRKQQCRANFEQSLMQEDVSERSPEDDMSFNELATSYAKALEQMPEKQRTVFLMSREEDMKYTEIADRLHISVKAVEKHVSAALRCIRSKLVFSF